MITTGSVSEEEGTTKAAPSTVQQMDIINVDADKARPGDLVEVQGLQSAAYLNGTKGYLVEFINNEQQWAVLSAARPGDLVEFQGLQSAAYLNGTKGYLVEFINNEQHTIYNWYHVIYVRFSYSSGIFQVRNISNINDSCGITDCPLV